MKELCYYGSSILRAKCKEVEEITPAITKIIDELLVAVKAHNGAGIAAPQIGYDVRIFINAYSEKIDRDGYPFILDKPEVIINPTIIRFSKRKIIRAEGCLSIPGIHLDVERSYDIDIVYMNEKGEQVVRKKVKKWLARCLQHELDHLDGILFTDHVCDQDLETVQPLLIALEKRTKESLNKSTDTKGFF